MQHGIDISMLIIERQKLRKALKAMDELLTSLEVDVSTLDHDDFGRVTLATAIKTVVSEMREGITKEGVIEALRRAYPQVKRNPQSVAAALVKLTQGKKPLLFIESRGAGSRPTIYTTEETFIFDLTGPEINSLFQDERTIGSGGWQSLFKRLQSCMESDGPEIILNQKLLQDMRHYYLNYGVGGWQNSLKSIFNSHLPELFRKPARPAADSGEPKLL